MELPTPEPFADNICGTQPGGGTIQSLELAWGRLRRALLKTLRPGYVRRMKQALRGDPTKCPIEIIDSRDLKYFRNTCDCSFDPAQDRFAWRDRLPFARAGLAELTLFAGSGLLLAGLCLTGWIVHPAWSILPAALAAFSLNFFRDPNRVIPADPELVLSPADGRIVEIADADDCDFVAVPSVKIGIFLNVFNVHVNRISRRGQLIRATYRPGRFLNALYAASAKENERMELCFVEPNPPHRRFVIRQIAGAIARRIVSELRSGETVETGSRIGMIKFGSRTELIVPKENLHVLVKIGDKVQGGSSVLARYATTAEESGAQAS